MGSASRANDDESVASDFDRYRQTLLTQQTAAGGDGWLAEVRSYLRGLEADASVSKDMDLVVWWQV